MGIDPRRWLQATAATICLLSTPASLNGQVTASITPAALAIQTATRTPLPAAILNAALTDSRPEMRLTAARIVGVTHALALAPRLTEALQQEQDVNTAVEQIRSLLLLRSPESMAAAFEYARQKEGQPLQMVASWLARTAPGELADQLPAFAGLTQPGEVLTVASKHWPAERQRLLRAWLYEIPAHWPRLLPSLLHADTLESDVAVVLEALRAADEGTREATVWSIVGRIADKLQVPEAVIDAVADLGVSTARPPTWEVLGRELVARSQRKAATPDRAEALATLAASHPGDIGSLHEFPALTDAERNALRARLGKDFRKRVLAIGPSGLELSDTPMMRAAPALYPGFLKTLLSESGCEWSRNQRYAAAQVTYTADGRPSRAELAEMSEGCRQALAGLVQVTIANESYRVDEGTKEWLVLFLHESAFACADVAEPDESRDESAIRSITPPRRTKMVRPTFPTAQTAATGSGSLVVEGTLSRTGCPYAVAVPRTSGTYAFKDSRTAFALAALEAVLQWRYEPARIDDVPTSVSLSITVVFNPR